MDYLDRIEKVRKDKGVTVEDLSEACGFKKSWYSSIKYRNRELKVRDFLKIAEYLDVNPCELLLESVEYTVQANDVLKAIKNLVAKDIEGDKNSK